MAELLDISNDSASRRIRGEKPVDLGELQQLAAHFRVSLDRLLHLSNDALRFTGKPQRRPAITRESWLTNILGQMQLMASAGQRHLYYLRKDIPPF